MPDKINTILNPNVIASIIVITVPITEKNAFSAHATGTYEFSSSLINEIPIGKGIPIKNPSGNIIMIEIKILNANGNVGKREKNIDANCPINIDKTNIIIKM